jgi:hypothetical protein
MRLLFWKAKSQPNFDPPKVVKKMAVERKLHTSDVNNVRSRPIQKKPVRSAKVIAMRNRSIPENAREVMPLKAWCDINLDPLAWSRIIIRMLPVFRDFNKNLSDMQRPGPGTFVEEYLYTRMVATIREIYSVEPKFIGPRQAKVG